MNTSEILIVGGYGVVGRRIAAELAPEHPGQVVIAGRNPARADEMAKLIGHGVRGKRIDITEPGSIANALDRVAVVISCVDQPDRKLLWAAIDRGLRYTDITPHLTQLGRGTKFYEIEAASIGNGARIVLGTGIVPGISNVMVRSLVNKIGGADVIETALLLDANDSKGPASLDYFLQEVAMSFDIWVEGKDVAARPFTAPKLVEFPHPIGSKLSYLFPFSDQVLYPHTLDVKTVTTRLALAPEWLAKLFAGSVRFGAARVVATDAFRRVFARLQKIRSHSSRSPFALRVDVRCGMSSGRATLVGRGQADAAAAGAAGIARLLIEDHVKPGAWMPEQIVDAEPFLSRLRAQGLEVKFEV